MGNAKTVSIPLFLIIFPLFPFFSHRVLFFSIKVLFSRPCQLPSLNMICNWPSPVCEFNQEGSIPLFYFFSIPNAFHDIFQLTCCSVRCSGCPPSVDRENMGPSLPSPVHELNGEGGNGEYSSCFYFFPTIPNVFHGNFQLTCCSDSCAGCHPSVNEGNKGSLPPSLAHDVQLVTCLQKRRQWWWVFLVLL